jgi:hypothetical protein
MSVLPGDMSGMVPDSFGAGCPAAPRQNSAAFTERSYTAITMNYRLVVGEEKRGRKRSADYADLR